VELARGGGDPEIAFNRIEREADRLNVLVGELIQVTRAEGDPAGLSTELLRLDDLIRVIVDDVHIEAERHHIELDLDVCGAELEGSPELLRRAIENVVRNAIRYSPEGGKVRVSLIRAGATYRVEVRDFGAGVPDESLAHIFDPFYRVETDRGRTSGGVRAGTCDRQTRGRTAPRDYAGMERAAWAAGRNRTARARRCAGTDARPYLFSIVMPLGSSNMVSGNGSFTFTCSE